MSELTVEACIELIKKLRPHLKHLDECFLIDNEEEVAGYKVKYKEWICEEECPFMQLELYGFDASGEFEGTE